MFIVTVKSQALGGLAVGVYASEASECVAADKVRRYVEQAIGRMHKADGKAQARKDPKRKASRKAWTKLMK